MMQYVFQGGEGWSGAAGIVLEEERSLRMKDEAKGQSTGSLLTAGRLPNFPNASVRKAPFSATSS
jgi:hypothetical protein